MLCLSGFELYSRWVPLIFCRHTIVELHHIFLKGDYAYMHSGYGLIPRKRECQP